jgi:hypothetical protein
VNQLLYVVVGWLGLITRAAVLWQVLAVIALVLAYRAWRLRHPAPSTSWSPVFAKLVLAALLWLIGSVLFLPSGCQEVWWSCSASWC